MPTLSSEKLKEQITSIPSELQRALEQQAKARLAVAQVQAQIDKLESEMEQASEQDDDDNTPDYDDLDDNLELVRLEAAVERAKLRVTEAEDKAEMEFRKTTEKTTEGLVKAAVGTNPKVMDLRNKLLDAKEAAKERKITLQDERMKARDARIEAMSMAKPNTHPVNNKLFDLQEKLFKATDALMCADVEVEVVRAKIETYKMLVSLEKTA